VSTNSLNLLLSLSEQNVYLRPNTASSSGRIDDLDLLAMGSENLQLMEIKKHEGNSDIYGEQGEVESKNFTDSLQRRRSRCLLQRVSYVQCLCFSFFFFFW
jgi:hypothetical protein